MAEPVEVAIQAALIAHLEALSFSPSNIDISYPNLAFTPPSPATPSASWLRVTFLQAPTLGLSVGHDGGANEHLGIMQVDVFWAMGSSEGPPGRTAAQIIEHFTRGTVVFSGSTRVAIDKAPFRGTLRQDDPWVMIPVSIPYHAYSPNPA